MIYLLLVSFVWAFSFGLIKDRLAGLDAVAVGTVRLGLAAVLFLPFLRLRGLPFPLVLRLTLIGAVQFGLMYVLYLQAFALLPAYQVALYTIFTPLYVALLNAALERRLIRAHAIAALLSVLAAGIMQWRGAPGAGSVTGFLLVQGSNLCFAIGQLAYKHIRIGRAAELHDARLFALLYLGGLAATAAMSAFVTDWSAFRPTGDQWMVLAYLGVLASGLCFFAWNVGATRVNAGTLAAFNNAKVPLAVACSLLFFGESAELPRLLASLALMLAAVWVAERRPETRA